MRRFRASERMIVSGESFANVIRQSAIELKNDKRKAVLLIVLAIGTCAAFAHLLIDKSPANAVGAVPGGHQVVGERIPREGTSDSPDAQACDERDRAAARDEYIRRIGRKIERDLFAPNPQFFPPRRESGSAKRTLARAATRPGDDEKRIERQMILAQAQSLVLQSTMISANPTAIINERIMQVGDWISGFQVTEVTPHTCKVRKNNVTVILEMSK